MICIVGMGPGHIKYLTQEAIEAIQRAEKVIAFGRIAETAEQIRSPIIRVTRVDEMLSQLEPNKHIAILASGDPGFYGILEYLKKQGVSVDTVIPGISSFQCLMAKLKKSWHAARFVSLHGREADIEQIVRHPLSILLTDQHNTPHVISKRLQKLGVQGTMYIGHNLSYEDEQITVKQIGDDIAGESVLATVVVEQDVDS